MDLSLVLILRLKFRSRKGFETRPVFSAVFLRFRQLRLGCSLIFVTYPCQRVGGGTIVSFVPTDSLNGLYPRGRGNHGEYLTTFQFQWDNSTPAAPGGFSAADFSWSGCPAFRAGENLQCVQRPNPGPRPSENWTASLLSCESLAPKPQPLE